ncbi:hypothetical protein BU15DRAFT_66102 [Melanogaster broomeanus]|nr:hypothetical protein BU15DRAFT_66102 [Melanogaster broomeanus]
MSESNSLVMAAWAPGLIGSQIGAGFAFASSLYGIALGQSIYYARHFPGDPRLTKLMVLLIFLGDTAHMIGSVQFYWELLISCHQSSSWTCETRLPWGMFVTLPVNYATTFAVQSFYGRRVWVISGNNKHITVAILFTAILQFVFEQIGMIYRFQQVLVAGAPWRRSIRIGTIEYFFTDPFILYAAAVSTLCDFLITGAVIKYMCNSDLRRRVNFIQDLAIVFINMGALTCAMSVLVGVIVTITGWGRPDLPSADASYVNSNLAVLNARRSIRQREERRLERTIELPTLSRII